MGGLQGGKHKIEELDYCGLMRQTLLRIEVAHLQIQQSSTIEELDLGRATLQVARAELQQVIRNAKRDRGIPLRPIAELEEFHRNMRDHMYHRTKMEISESRQHDG